MDNLLSFFNLFSSVALGVSLVCEVLLNKNELTLFLEKYEGKLNWGIEKDIAALLDSVVVGRLSDCSASTNLFGNDCLDELIEEGFVGFETKVSDSNE